MKDVCDLERTMPNYAWCFDCVPEENSLLLAFGDEKVEIPSIDLILLIPDSYWVMLCMAGLVMSFQYGLTFLIR